MYRDILTICWSIKEVNRNLSDRKSVTDLLDKVPEKCLLRAGGT